MAKQLDLRPIEQWEPRWIVFKVAMIIGRPEYLSMNDQDKRKANLPITRDEMLAFIKSKA
jgi:hypothetical protein